MERIVIRFVERPDSKDPKQVVRWFCSVFGLSNENESADSIEEQILEKFIAAAYHNQGLASSELKLKTKLARSTIIYHLNRFIDAGLLVKKGRRYYLRGSEMSKAIEEIEYDINREIKRMLDTAKELDRTIGSKFQYKQKEEMNEYIPLNMPESKVMANKGVINRKRRGKAGKR